jgi:hypothetical protein
LWGLGSLQLRRPGSLRPHRESQLRHQGSLQQQWGSLRLRWGSLLLRLGSLLLRLGSLLLLRGRLWAGRARMLGLLPLLLLLGQLRRPRWGQRRQSRQSLLLLRGLVLRLLHQSLRQGSLRLQTLLLGRLPWGLWLLLAEHAAWLVLGLAQGHLG